MMHKRCLSCWVVFAWVMLVVCGGACDDSLIDPPADAGVQETTRDAGGTGAPPEQTLSERIPEQLADVPPSVHVPYHKTWYGGRVIYQMFPRSFYDSDGDGIGDLKGITAKLDYLNTGKADTTTDLKVSGIWLTPIFKSGSYHGYDVQDYKALDPAYGSIDDLKTLLQEAHRRGIKVILDLVLNHTSSRHPWFVDASSGAGASKRDWYVWSETDPGWSHPFSVGDSPWRALNGVFFYAVFSPSMPDLNLKQQAVRDALQDVIQFWLQQGVDGFRLDAIRYLIAEGAKGQVDSDATHRYLKEMAAFARKQRPDVLLVGEAWTTTQEVAKYFGRGDEIDLCFHFDMVDALDRAFQRERTSSMRTALANILRTYPELQFNAPILGNHDHKRVWSRLLQSPSAMKLAAVVLLTLPGTPFVYYGEELGMGMANNPGDIAKRAPMQWDATAKAGFSKGIPWARLYGKQETVSVSVQQQQPGSLLRHYQRLIRLRQANPALKWGGMVLLDSSGDNAASGLVWVREWKETTKTHRVLVAINVSTRASLSLLVAKSQLPGVSESTTWINHATGKEVTLSAVGDSFQLPAMPTHGYLLLEQK